MNRKMFYYSKCTVRVLLALLKLPSISVKKSSWEVAAFHLENWCKKLICLKKFDHKFINFFPRTNFSGCFYLCISSFIRLFSHREEYSDLFSVCNYFSIGFKNISPVTSTKFNESSELTSSGKSKNCVTLTFTGIICQTLCV